MKFASITVSLLACGSILGSPLFLKSIPHLSVSDNSQNAQNNNDHSLKPIFNAEEIYDYVQELAKIPKEEFIRDVNDFAKDIEAVCNQIRDFFQRLSKLSPEQRKQLDDLASEISKKYTEHPPADMAEFEKQIGEDLKKIGGIVYNTQGSQMLSYFSSLFSSPQGYPQIPPSTNY